MNGSTILVEYNPPSHIKILPRLKLKKKKIKRHLEKGRRYQEDWNSFRTILTKTSLLALEGWTRGFSRQYSRQRRQKWQKCSYVTLRCGYFNLATQALYYFSRGVLLNLPERSGSSNPYNRRILPEPRYSPREQRTEDEWRIERERERDRDRDRDR